MKLLVASNFSFSHSVFKRLVSKGHQKVSLCGNGLNGNYIIRVFFAFNVVENCGKRRKSIHTRRPVLDSSKLKVCRWQFQIWRNGRKLSKWIENTVGKGEIAHCKQFLVFPQCFQKACFPGPSKGVIVWEWVKWRLYHWGSFYLKCGRKLWEKEKIPSYQTLQYLKHKAHTTGLKLVAIVLMFSNMEISEDLTI